MPATPLQGMHVTTATLALETVADHILGRTQAPIAKMSCNTAICTAPLPACPAHSGSCATCNRALCREPPGDLGCNERRRLVRAEAAARARKGRGRRLDRRRQRGRVQRLAQAGQQQHQRRRDGGTCLPRGGDRPAGSGEARVGFGGPGLRQTLESGLTATPLTAKAALLC